eukprot:scaffold11005_cov25-Tisochrysis_lutea.AAC.4
MVSGRPPAVPFDGAVTWNYERGLAHSQVAALITVALASILWANRRPAGVGRLGQACGEAVLGTCIVDGSRPLFCPKASNDIGP